MIKDFILDDIADRAMFKLAELAEKIAAGKGGISNPMGGSAGATASKPVKTAPIMSAAPINDLMPKATTAMTAGLPNLMNNMNQATQQATQSGVMNNAVLPWNNKSGEYNLEKIANIFASNGFVNPAISAEALDALSTTMPQTGVDAVKTLAAPVTGFASGWVNGLLPQSARLGARKLYKSFPKDSNNLIKSLAGNSALLLKKLQKKGVNMTRPQNIVGQAMYLPAFIAGVSPFT